MQFCLIAQLMGFFRYFSSRKLFTLYWQYKCFQRWMAMKTNHVCVIRPRVVYQPVLNSSPLLCSAQGITTASPPPPTPLRVHLMVRGYLQMAPSPLNTWTRASPRRSSSSSATLQDLASRLSGETLTDWISVCCYCWLGFHCTGILYLYFLRYCASALHPVNRFCLARSRRDSYLISPFLRMRNPTSVRFPRRLFLCSGRWVLNRILHLVFAVLHPMLSQCQHSLFDFVLFI